MRTSLLSIGFIEISEGVFYNQEVGLEVVLIDDEHVSVPTAKGNISATMAELEDVIVAGGFGEF